MATDVNTALSNAEIARLARATSRGTPIVKKGEEMDQNSFLKILSAELTNQDPTAAKDGTAYVAQMAQFASLEQMTNLSSTISFSNSSSLVGKMVAFDSYDETGKQYGGTVKAAFKESGANYMAVELSDGTLKNFPADTLSDVIDASDSTSDYSNGNAGFSAAISLMGKHVATAPLEDGVVYSGTIKSVSRDAKGINLTIAYLENGEELTKNVSYGDIVKVEE
ncbi:MAG: flagellar biosynthesis protein FlgD [Clostridiaceae bacterium]|nr:flagellar biosynthesis protein FlgD [Clostridiaceae bacterium]